MIRIETDGLVYYRFESPAFRDLPHGAFTRYGGRSRPPYDGLNMSFFEDEDQGAVAGNIEKAVGALGLDMPASVGQVHGDRALVVRAGDGYRPRQRSEIKSGYDALITPDPGVALLTKLADCQGVVLYDPSSGVLGLVHSGWRGSVQNVLGKTARVLIDDFGADPETLAAGVGPSLGPCCAQFVNHRTELPESFQPYRDGDRFDFWAVSRDQLAAEGLKRENVEISGICTKCGGLGFYSYRGEKTTGRFGLIAGLPTGREDR